MSDNPKHIAKAPPMVRLARKLAGPRANAEALGVAIAMIPLVLLGLWISWGSPWTQWGLLMSAYYFLLPISAFLISRAVRAGLQRRLPVRLLYVVLWATGFLLWYPSILGGMFVADLTHAATALFGAVVVWALMEGFATREPGSAS
jgi:hypothetical protein